MTYHEVAHWVPPVSHSLIVLIALPLGLLLRRRGARGADPLALLALLFLLRCVLDPVDQGYFHVPFMLALLAWEVSAGALRMGGLPPVTLAAAACLALTFDVLQAHGVNAWVIDSLYLGLERRDRLVSADRAEPGAPTCLACAIPGSLQYGATRSESPRTLTCALEDVERREAGPADDSVAGRRLSRAPSRSSTGSSCSRPRRPA